MHGLCPKINKTPHRRDRSSEISAARKRGKEGMDFFRHDPGGFREKWSGMALTERSAAREHFLGRED